MLERKMRSHMLQSEIHVHVIHVCHSAVAEDAQPSISSLKQVVCMCTRVRMTASMSLDQQIRDYQSLFRANKQKCISTHIG